MCKYLCLLICVVIMCVGCNSTPDYVISQEKMAQLLVDIHIGESVVDANMAEYELDSVKKALKQSIYIKHGVTSEQVDTSFIWYGENIEKYIDVYDNVIAILETEINNINVPIESSQLIIAGDSVDAWIGPRHRLIAYNTPDNYVSFSLNRDENWENGDVYEWRMKLINNKSIVDWNIVVDYVDGTSDYKNIKITQSGWHDLKMYTDSTKVMSRIYGVAVPNINTSDRFYIDSISLIRTRLNPKYYRRRFGQQLFEYGVTQNEKD